MLPARNTEIVQRNRRRWDGGRLARRPPTAEKSFGHYCIEMFAAVADAMILHEVADYILHEAIQRFAAPPEVTGLPMRRPSYAQPAEIRNASTTASLPFRCRSSRSA